MSPYLEAAISIGIVVGGVFVLVGSLGLIKLPDVMSRLHAPSKATTLGVGGCLFASMLHTSEISGTWSIQELLIMFFLFLTAPVTAHFIAKAHLHTEDGEASQLSATPNPNTHWNTFSPHSHAKIKRCDEVPEPPTA